VALVPPGVVTVTSTVPGLPAGEVAVTVVAFTAVTLVAAFAPKWTAVAPVRFVPVIVTVVPPPVGPEDGVMLVTVGAGVAQTAITLATLALVASVLVTTALHVWSLTLPPEAGCSEPRSTKVGVSICPPPPSTRFPAEHDAVTVAVDAAAMLFRVDGSSYPGTGPATQTATDVTISLAPLVLSTVVVQTLLATFELEVGWEAKFCTPDGTRNPPPTTTLPDGQLAVTVAALFAATAIVLVGS
jgi:hypothetical protein